MSSHRGAEPEVKLCRFQSYRQTLQADPLGGPFYGSLSLWELENEKISEKVEAGNQVLEKTGALKNYNDGFSMPWTINYKSLILQITAKNTITFWIECLPSRQQLVFLNFSNFYCENQSRQHLHCNMIYLLRNKTPCCLFNSIFFFYSKMDTLSRRVKNVI